MGDLINLNPDGKTIKEIDYGIARALIRLRQGYMSCITYHNRSLMNRLVSLIIDNSFEIKIFVKQTPFGDSCTINLSALDENFSLFIREFKDDRRIGIRSLVLHLRYIAEKIKEYQEQKIYLYMGMHSEGLCSIKLEMFNKLSMREIEDFFSKKLEGI